MTRNIGSSFSCWKLSLQYLPKNPLGCFFVGLLTLLSYMKVIREESPALKMSHTRTLHCVFDEPALPSCLVLYSERQNKRRSYDALKYVSKRILCYSMLFQTNEQTVWWIGKKTYNSCSSFSLPTYTPSSKMLHVLSLDLCFNLYML